jgi:hypothetical protein
MMPNPTSEEEIAVITQQETEFAEFIQREKEEKQQENLKIPQPEMTQVDRVNMTQILTLAAQSTRDPNAKECIREGFESFIQNYDGKSPPFTVDENGDHWTWPDAILFILDHMSPSYSLIAIKRQISAGNVAFEDCDVGASAGRQFTNYVVTGVDNGIINKHDNSRNIFRDAKKTYKMVMCLVEKICNVLQLY